MNSLQALTANAAAIKVSEALEQVGVEKVEAAMALVPLYQAETWKEKLDAFQVDVGADHATVLMENPDFASILSKWEKEQMQKNGRKVAAAMLEILPKDTNITERDILYFLTVMQDENA